MTIRDTIGRWGKRALVAGLAVHGLSLAAIIANDVKHLVTPSSIRADFREAYGFPVRGWSKDVEGDVERISQLSEVTAREMAERSFDVTAVSLDSESYLGLYPLDQLNRVLTFRYSGAWNPFSDIVSLFDKNSIRDVCSHEYKHAKTGEILLKDIDFSREWKALAKDGVGASLYSASGQFANVRGLNRILPKIEELPDQDLLERGFVSNYARTNFLEDIAETSEWASSFAYSGQLPDRVAQFVLEHPDSALTRKLTLAQERKLIPEGFVEYLGLMQALRDARPLAERMSSYDAVKAYEFVNHSAMFIAKYSNSTIVPELHAIRSGILASMVVRDDAPWATQAAIVNERLAALRSPLKPDSYVAILGNLAAQADGAYGNDAVKQNFDAAVEEYWKRWSAGDVRLAARGVDDFLEREGLFAWIEGCADGSIPPVNPRGNAKLY